jgi:RNA polymerase sigma-70 factor (ECF subfamily)
MLDAESDGELVRRIAAGSGGARDAEAELCRRFAERARLYGLRHLRTEDRARDLAQAVLLAVLEAARAGRIEEPDRVDRFVLGTCRNVAGRLREHESRQRATPDTELDVIAVMPAEERIDTPALFKCLAALERRAREVVLMSFRDQQSSGEIATSLSMSQGNVRVMRHRAVVQLRRCLDAGKEARG